MRRAAALSSLLAAAALLVGATSTPRPRVRPTPTPLDFSGVWEIDEAASANVPSQMRGAVLSVTQKGNRIWISPLAARGKGSMVLSEELIVDGRAYEKALGPAGKGNVTARWGNDGASLWIDVQAASDSDPQKRASQRSVWKLSQDRKVWVRESVSISQGTPREARLVFRKRPPEAAPASTPRRPPRAPRTPRPSPTP